MIHGKPPDILLGELADGLALPRLDLV